jgi:hypothetical protein
MNPWAGCSSLSSSRPGAVPCGGERAADLIIFVVVCRCGHCKKLAPECASRSLFIVIFIVIVSCCCSYATGKDPVLTFTVPSFLPYFNHFYYIFIIAPSVAYCYCYCLLQLLICHWQRSPLRIHVTLIPSVCLLLSHPVARARLLSPSLSLPLLRRQAR